MRDLFRLAKKLGRRLAPEVTLALDAPNLDVSFSNGRGQRIRARREGEDYVLTSRVASRRVLDDLSWEQLAELVWERNARVPVVAFMLDRRGRLVGRVRNRADTLQPEELRVYLLLLARECDRLEYLLTGRDEH